MESHHYSMAGGHHSMASGHHSTAGDHHSMASASGTGLLFSRERDARAVFGCHHSSATTALPPPHQVGPGLGWGPGLGLSLGLGLGLVQVWV